MDQGQKLASLRTEYALGGLDVPDLTDEPQAMFHRWLDDAVAAGLHEPNAMVISTVSAGGRPSSRMVLLKGVTEEGFVFFSNYASRKGVDLDAQPACSLLFPWHPLERQVRVEGTATRLTPAVVETYFRSRPRDAQLGAWASPQSREVASRAELEAAYSEAEERFGDGDIPVPPSWGGYLVTPHEVEFWQGRRSRLHDRLVYRRDGDGWTVVRLAP